MANTIWFRFSLVENGRLTYDATNKHALKKSFWWWNFSSMPLALTEPMVRNTSVSDAISKKNDSCLVAAKLLSANDVYTFRLIPITRDNIVFAVSSPRGVEIRNCIITAVRFFKSKNGRANPCYLTVYLFRYFYYQTFFSIFLKYKT